MVEEAIQSYRAVICRCCRQPIPLPGIVLHIESSLMNDGGELERNERSFGLRCRSCEREMAYRTSDIVGVEGTPKPRLSRTNGGRNTAALTRAANA
jgi:hypothetical protein